VAINDPSPAQTAVHGVDHGPLSTGSAAAANFSSRGAVITCVHAARVPNPRRKLMNNIIYIIGLVVVVIAILSFLGMR
jgi:small-conductance mechanosensitive channel